MSIDKENKEIDSNIGNLKFTGWFAWIIWMFVHLVSLVGFRNKVIAFANWVVQYFQYNKGVRLIIRPYPRGKDYVDDNKSIFIINILNHDKNKTPNHRVR